MSSFVSDNLRRSVLIILELLLHYFFLSGIYECWSFKNISNYRQMSLINLSPTEDDTSDRYSLYNISIKIIEEEVVPYYLKSKIKVAQHFSLDFVTAK